jgi:hypothetical protein
MTETTHVQPSATTTRAWRLTARARRTALTIHIASSVGLLGSTAALLLLALTATGTDDPAFAASIYRLMSSFSLVFGIPLSFAALLSGILLGAGTRWGVLRYWWTTAKLLLIVGVIFNGALNSGPSVDALRHGAGSEPRLVIAAALSVTMLLIATTLSTFKPGGRRRAPASRRRRTRAAAGRPSRTSSH